MLVGVPLSLIKRKKIANPSKWDVPFCRNTSHPKAGRASAHHHFPPVQQLPDVRTAKLSGCIVRAVVDFSVVDCSPSTKSSRKFFYVKTQRHTSGTVEVKAIEGLGTI